MDKIQTLTKTSPAEEFENFLEFVEAETLPVLQICKNSMGSLDDAGGQIWMLEKAVAGLKAKCRSIQNFLNDNHIWDERNANHLIKKFKQNFAD